MTTQEHSSEAQRETFTEWGVRWPDGGTVKRHYESDARDFAANINAIVVCRTVTRSPWREPISMDDVAAAIETGNVLHCDMLGVEYWPDCGRCEGTGHVQECPDCGGIGKTRPGGIDA